MWLVYLILNLGWSCVSRLWWKVWAGHNGQQASSRGDEEKLTKPGFYVGCSSRILFWKTSKGGLLDNIPFEKIVDQVESKALARICDNDEDNKTVDEIKIQ